jgi:DNA/RNA-binding domain of Phe-tRNA-synthetase-like protein
MHTPPTLCYDASLHPRLVRAAIVWGFHLPACPKTVSPPAHLTQILERVRATGEKFLSPERKAAVRNMLRFGSYKPAGRSKPSSEYLLAAALEKDFPLVNGPVDVNNAVSLEWGYPASIFDMDRCGTELPSPRGMEGEAYIFNPSGQSIVLKDLLCVCRKAGTGWEPCGNPVKDAMATKTSDATRNVVAVIYAPLSETAAELEAAAKQFAALLIADCGAAETGWAIASTLTETL